MLHTLAQGLLLGEPDMLPVLVVGLQMLPNFCSSSHRHVLAGIIGLWVVPLVDMQWTGLVVPWRHTLSVVIPDTPQVVVVYMPMSLVPPMGKCWAMLPVQTM